MKLPASEWLRTQPPEEAKVLALVESWQSAVRNENVGFGSASSSAARATDTTRANLERAIRDLHPMEIARMLYRLNGLLRDAESVAKEKEASRV